MLKPDQIDGYTIELRIAEALQRRSRNARHVGNWIAEQAATMAIPKDTFEGYYYAKSGCSAINLVRMAAHFDDGVDGFLSDVLAPVGLTCIRTSDHHAIRTGKAIRSMRAVAPGLRAALACIADVEDDAERPADEAAQ